MRTYLKVLAEHEKADLTLGERRDLPSPWAYAESREAKLALLEEVCLANIQDPPPSWPPYTQSMNLRILPIQMLPELNK